MRRQIHLRFPSSRPILLALIATIITSVPLAAPAQAGVPQPGTFRARVVHVIDGDTADFQLDLRQRIPAEYFGRQDVPQGKVPRGTVRVRFVGIDTPETHLPFNGQYFGQNPWGDLATRFLTQLLPVGAEVTLVSLPQETHGRAVARVYLGTQRDQLRDVNLELTAAGWGTPFAFCPGDGTCSDPVMHVHEIAKTLAACEQARQRGLGVFDPRSSLREMPFEFRDRIRGIANDMFVASARARTYLPPSQYRRIDVCDRIFFQREADARAAGFRPAR